MFLAKFFEPKPFNQGYLPEVDGHKVFFWEFGNPKGKVIMSTHGGPGGSNKVSYIKDLDLKKYRVIVFDQRGCGKSLPLGSVEKNTTKDTIKDMARLLDYLNIKEKVIVRGYSWASTLALLFAEAYPERIDKLFVSMIFLADNDYKKWMYEESAKIYPDIMDKIKASNKTKKSLAQDCFDKLCSNDEKQIVDALSNFGGYENVLGKLNPKTEINEYSEKDLVSAKIFMHYEINDYFMEDNQIIKNASKIAHIPTLIIHNRMDFCCLVDNAYKLYKSMPKSKLIIVPDMGHGSLMLGKVCKKEFRAFLSER